MNMNFRENMALLHTLSDEHYYNRISFAAYREKRSQLLQLIDEDLNGVKVLENKLQESEANNDSLIDKALSFLKIDKVKETN